MLSVSTNLTFTSGYSLDGNFSVKLMIFVLQELLNLLDLSMNNDVVKDELSQCQLEISQLKLQLVERNNNHHTITVNIKQSQFFLTIGHPLFFADCGGFCGLWPPSIPITLLFT